MRILIADDDPISLAILRKCLVDGGFEVICANNGKKALEILNEGSCRLVITDWEMPEMSGLELCQQVRRGSLPAYVYLILLTSRDTREERIAGLSAGADDFVTKPFEPRELLARVRAAERILSLETRDVAIFALAKLAESRNPETGSHLERVMNYSRILAQELVSMNLFVDEIDADYVRLVYTTSPLHDFGKVGIPDCVLLKPGRLNDREFEIMKTHASIGADTLSAALVRFPGTRFLEMARDIAASHHEHYDGNGYPHGLKGDQIPLCGRIVALADVYDALTSKRVYKEAFAHDVARSVIESESGTHFAPEVVEAFLQSSAEFEQVRARFSNPLSQAA